VAVCTHFADGGAGAMDLARRGWGLQQILQHYYPGTSLQPLAGLQPPMPPAEQP
jgi:hypothetical protein